MTPGEWKNMLNNSTRKYVLHEYLKYGNESPKNYPEFHSDLKGRHRQARRGEGGKMEQQINQHLPAPDFLPHLPSLIPSTPHQRNPNLNSKLRLRSAIRKTNSVFCVKLCGLFSLHQPLYIIHTSHGWVYT